MFSYSGYTRQLSASPASITLSTNQNKEVCARIWVSSNEPDAVSFNVIWENGEEFIFSSYPSQVIVNKEANATFCFSPAKAGFFKGAIYSETRDNKIAIGIRISLVSKEVKSQKQTNNLLLLFYVLASSLSLLELVFLLVLVRYYKVKVEQ